MIKNCNLLISRPPYLDNVQGTGEAFNRRILQPSKENIQHFKTWKFFTYFYFCGSFLPSWNRIRILNADPDPDPATQINADPCGSGSTTLLTANLPAWWKAWGKSRSPAPSAAFTIRNTEPSVLVPWTQQAFKGTILRVELFNKTYTKEAIFYNCGIVLQCCGRIRIRIQEGKKEPQK